MYALDIHTYKLKKGGGEFNDVFSNPRGTIIYKVWKPLNLLNHLTPDLNTQCTPHKTNDLNCHPLIRMFLGNDFSGH
jgi:hypothetical protein